MKLCQRCKAEKAEDAFRPQRRTCLECERFYGWEYEAAHREERRRKARAYRSRKPESQTNWRKYGNPLRYRLSVYKGGARPRGLAWTLTDAEAAWLMMEPCFYCGTEQAPCGGLDRMDPQHGYEWANVVPCCTTCNLAKQDLTTLQFLALCKTVALRPMERG